MKKNWIYVAVVILLVGTAYFLSQKNSENVVRTENREFGIKDTASITKIVISDKKPSEAVIEKKEDGKWYVNGKYPVRKDAIELVLETLYRQTMRNYVNESAKPNILKKMAVSGKEVRVYAGEEEIKHFYVGDNPQDMLGTYMMLHNATEPYVVHMEGFNGFLSVRYFTQEDLWRSRLICDLGPGQLKSVQIEYTHANLSGFTLESNGLDDVQILDEAGQAYPFSPETATSFLSNFQNLQFEGLITDKDAVWQKKDSILSSPPLFEMTIEDTYGNSNYIRGFYKSALEGETDRNGDPLLYDRDRYYAQLNGDDMILIQRVTFDKILRPIEYFAKDE